MTQPINSSQQTPSAQAQPPAPAAKKTVTPQIFQQLQKIAAEQKRGLSHAFPRRQVVYVHIPPRPQSR